MELASQPDLRQLNDSDNNTFKPRGAAQQGDWRPSDYGDVGSLSGFNSGNNIPGLCRTPPEPYPQGYEPFPRNSFIHRGNPLAVMGLPGPHSETSGRKERNQLLVSCEGDWEAERVTPPVKRWRFGNLQIPIITCSKQFEEKDTRLKCELGKPNEKPGVWSFDKETEITDETDVNQNCYKEITEKFEFNSDLFGGVTESRCDEVCENGQNEIGEYSRSPEFQGYLKEMPILTSHLPDHPTLVSISTGDFDQYTEDKQKASMLEREPAKVEDDVDHSAGK